ncbi:hypothetical protein PFNF135_04975 [Plasmodium falciparum NF135/5.C10]|uniref:Uncharacterized protein n=1 Tax=Plasmodium falciparum NF135/5.C10 TaxID=1036726 RepID=W4IAH2_PLAFA|nr:hypothetical protein PFNF135_04975 [Plasmodium falciparum NF135/5.C10]
MNNILFSFKKKERINNVNREDRKEYSFRKQYKEHVFYMKMSIRFVILNIPKYFKILWFLNNHYCKKYKNNPKIYPEKIIICGMKHYNLIF